MLAQNLDCGGSLVVFLNDMVIIVLIYFSMLYDVKPISQLERLWSVPGCLLLSFFNVTFFCWPVHFMLRYLPRSGSMGLGPSSSLWQLIVWPGARREEAAGSFFQQQRENTCFAFCFLAS